MAEKPLALSKREALGGQLKAEALGAQLKAEALGAQLSQAFLFKPSSTDPLAIPLAVPIFYEAPPSRYAVGSPRRGGVPVLFPQFATHGVFGKHGFVRQMPWQVLQPEVQANELAWQATLQATPASVKPYNEYETWLHTAVLSLAVQQTAATLKVTLKVTNTGSTEFSFTGGLHPYFLWSEGNCTIQSEDCSVRRVVEQSALGGAVVEELLGNADVMQIIMADRLLTLRKFGFREWML